MLTKILSNHGPEIYDFEKEKQRWQGFLKIVHQPKPNFNNTPKQAVWKKNKATLWHYPAVEKKYNIPIFFIPSLIGKPHVFDLAPGTSVFGNFVNSGYDVYFLDLGVPGYEDKDINIEDYIEDYIKKAVRRTLRHSGADEISVVGYCFGGILASIYASIAEEPIKNLVLITVPLDFGVTILPEAWMDAIKNDSLNLDRMIDVYGLIPADYIDKMFKSCMGQYVILSPYAALLNRAHDKRFVEKWHRINYWTNDQIPMSGEALRQLNNDFIKENKLIRGEFSVRGKKANLKNINASLLVVSAKNDTIVLEEQSRPIMDLVSSEDKTYQLVEGGHTNLAISGKLAHIISPWLSHRSE
ncbi:alpha/beta fold hydrolase [Neobacillus sp. NRS-1170]|uniref:alpha/beta fold hydrolase n=1 Tax=Neobacillus sp. NRS-1170 TaxID=3233898 RepID=UPI003D2B1D3D